MPAKDIYHYAIVNALRKDGWSILNEQYPLVLNGKRAWIDIRAAKEDVHRIIMVLGMKSFFNLSAPAEAFRTTGEYSYCNAIINGKGIQADLFLAVPKSAYDTIFKQRVGQALLKRQKVKLIVFDAEKEEILQWIE